MSHVYTLSTFCKQRWEAPDIAGSIDILNQKHLCVPCLIQDGKWFTWLTWVSQASVCHSCFPVVPPVSAVTIPVRILHYQHRSSWPSRPCQTNPPVDVSLQRFWPIVLGLLLNLVICLVQSVDEWDETGVSITQTQLHCTRKFLESLWVLVHNQVCLVIAHSTRRRRLGY